MSGLQSALLGASGGIKPTGLINGVSVLLATMVPNGYPFDKITGSVRQVQPGAVTAGTLKTVFSAAGRGALGFVACASVNATGRTHRIKITLDGVVVFDATCAATTDATTSIFCAIGSVISTANSTVALTEYLNFDTSVLIEYASSLSETNMAYIGYRYIPR